MVVAPSDTNINKTGNSTSFEILVMRKGEQEFATIHSEESMTKSTSPISIEDLDVSDADWIEFKAIENQDEGYLSGTVLMVANAHVS